MITYSLALTYILKITFQFPFQFIAHSLPFADNTSDTDGWGFLSKFVADAPTTTLQRLSALTTGSLPTFFDLAHNFGRFVALFTFYSSDID